MKRQNNRLFFHFFLKQYFSKRFWFQTGLDSNKEWITHHSTQNLPTHTTTLAFHQTPWIWRYQSFKIILDQQDWALLGDFLRKASSLGEFGWVLKCSSFPFLSCIFSFSLFISNFPYNPKTNRNMGINRSCLYYNHKYVKGLNS